VEISIFRRPDCQDYLRMLRRAGLFRTFNVLDDFNREVLTTSVDTTLPADRIVRVLDRVFAWRGMANKLRLDNGPELVSVALTDWTETREVTLEFIQPGKPTQNSFIERRNRTFGESVINFPCFQ